MKLDTQEYLWVLVPLSLLGLSKLRIFYMYIIRFVVMVAYMYTDFQTQYHLHQLYAIFCVCTALSCSVVSNSLQPVDCSQPGSSVHVDSPGKNTGVGCRVLLQGILPTQGLN